MVELLSSDEDQPSKPNGRAPAERRPSQLIIPEIFEILSSGEEASAKVLEPSAVRPKKMNFVRPTPKARHSLPNLQVKMSKDEVIVIDDSDDDLATAPPASPSSSQLPPFNNAVNHSREAATPSRDISLPGPDFDMEPNGSESRQQDDLDIGVTPDDEIMRDISPDLASGVYDKGLDAEMQGAEPSFEMDQPPVTTGSEGLGPHDVALDVDDDAGDIAHDDIMTFADTTLGPSDVPEDANRSLAEPELEQPIVEPLVDDDSFLTSSVPDDSGKSSEIEPAEPNLEQPIVEPLVDDGSLSTSNIPDDPGKSFEIEPAGSELKQLIVEQPLVVDDSFSTQNFGQLDSEVDTKTPIVTENLSPQLGTPATSIPVVPQMNDAEQTPTAAPSVTETLPSISQTDSLFERIRDRTRHPDDGVDMRGLEHALGISIPPKKYSVHTPDRSLPPTLRIKASSSPRLPARAVSFCIVYNFHVN